MNDVLNGLVALRPDATTIDRAWTPQQQSDTLAAVLAQGQGPAARDHRLTRPPRHVRRRRLAIGAMILAVAAAAVSLQVVLPRSSPGGATPAAAEALEGLAITAAASDPVDAAGPGQFRHLVVQTWQAAMPDRQVPETWQTFESWTASDGRSWRHNYGHESTGHKIDQTLAFAPGGDQTFSASPAFLAGLPTDAGRLRHYLRSHASGSSSRDEAVFVAVGDLLRTGLAPPKLRVAAIRVLERTPHVTIGTTHADALGRSVIRFDFVDNGKRTNEIQSLLFDSTTAALAEEIESYGSGQPWFTSTLVRSGVTSSVPAQILAHAQPVH
jgi:hypothetical protein